MYLMCGQCGTAGDVIAWPAAPVTTVPWPTTPEICFAVGWSIQAIGHVLGQRQTNMVAR
jgi:hypothetical protein